MLLHPRSIHRSLRCLVLNPLFYLFVSCLSCLLAGATCPARPSCSSSSCTAQRGPGCCGTPYWPRVASACCRALCWSRVGSCCYTHSLPACYRHYARGPSAYCCHYAHSGPCCSPACCDACSSVLRTRFLLHCLLLHPRSWCQLQPRLHLQLHPGLQRQPQLHPCPRSRHRLKLRPRWRSRLRPRPLL